MQRLNGFWLMHANYSNQIRLKLKLVLSFVWDDNSHTNEQLANMVSSYQVDDLLTRTTVPVQK